MEYRQSRGGPVEKFYLLKVHGTALHNAGYRQDDLKRFSCADLRKAIALLRQED